MMIVYYSIIIIVNHNNHGSITNETDQDGMGVH